MAKHRRFEVLLVLIIASLFSLWTLREPAEEGPTASPTPPLTDVSRTISINGVSLGMTLEQVTALFGPSLSEVNGKLIGDTYNFGREQGAMGFADFTGIQLGEDNRVSFIHGSRLEIDGQRIAEEFWALNEQERAKTVEKLKEAFPEARFNQNGSQKAELADERLVISLSSNGSWTFRLGERGN